MAIKCSSKPDEAEDKAFETYLGAIRDPASKEGDPVTTWRLTKDVKEFETADSDSVIAAQTLDDLVAILNQQNPAVQGLSYVAAKPAGWHGATPSACVHVQPLAAPDTPEDLLFELARKLGSVDVTQSNVLHYKPYSTEHQIVNASFYIDRDSGCLIYDPKKVARLTGARKRAKSYVNRYGCMRISELINITYEIAQRATSNYPSVFNGYRYSVDSVFYYESVSSRAGVSAAINKLCAVFKMTDELKTWKCVLGNAEVRKWLTSMRYCMPRMKETEEYKRLHTWLLKIYKRLKWSVKPA